MTKTALSDAVRIYIGKGITKAPHPDRFRLAHAIGEDQAQELLPAIMALLEEMDAIPVDWSTLDLNAATDLVIGIMRQRHPELDDSAIMALDWLYSWVNR